MKRDLYKFTYRESKNKDDFFTQSDVNLVVSFEKKSVSAFYNV